MTARAELSRGEAMSSLRTHDDTWDIATSVGSTAVMVAAARAAETERADASDLRSVRRDPGRGRRDRDVADDARRSDRRESRRHRPRGWPRSSGTCATIRRSAPTSSTSTSRRPLRRESARSSSWPPGLDSRAYRIDWPEDTTIFEIDQPKVLEYKAATLADHGVKPAAQLHEVPVDLRHDWPKALRDKRLRCEPARQRGWPRAC